MEIKNDTLKAYHFLEKMYEDDYYPNEDLDKGRNILINLCREIENNSPKNLAELYVLTHKATNEFNDLEESGELEIETVARECIAMDFEFIAQTYGFDAECEELIATRDW